MIVVVGAGIIGCATAYQLARSGHPVMVVDAAAGPGLGCSYANGAQLSYSYVEPLASPATLRALPKLLLQRDSPVRFGPTLDWRQYAWGAQFLLACRDVQVQRATRQLLELSALSRDTLQAWRRDGVVPDSYRCAGKLVLCQDRETLARQERQMAFQATLGCRQQVLNLDQCLEREPALGGALRRAPRAWVGGIWTPGECVVDAHALSCALLERTRRLGGLARFGVRVTGFATGSGGVRALRTTAGDIDCDALVLAAGSESARLGASLAEYLPVYPIRGYSLSLSMDRSVPAPSVSVTDLGRKAVFAPLGATLRVAAAAEIGGHGLPLPRKRIEQMRAAAGALFPGLVSRDDAGQPWVGLRPATPTSVPLIRPMRRHRNVYLNVGHGALGLTLAAGSAVVLERQLMAASP